jgi:NAD(P)-dependent dehydrogenase (short-subunit alcohol dehydrogenase family)
MTFVARFGGLDVLVNNAAIGVESGETVDDPSVDTAALDRMHATKAGLMRTQIDPRSPEVLQVMVSSLAITRISDPTETAAVIAFLASPAAPT